MTTIYLIRHSISFESKRFLYENMNNEQLINEKLPLSPVGEKKALELSSLEELTNIDSIYSSEYERAISTAKYIAFKNNLAINITNKLNERKLGDISNVSESFWLQQLYDENIKAIDGENRKEVKKRMLSCINSILEEHKNERIVLVSHACAITYLLMNWCELVKADLKTKSRHLVYKDKTIINDTFRCPEIFKLEFDQDALVNISLIRE